MLINDIQKERSTLVADFAVIKTEYELLIADEYPILYTGKNLYGSWIVGSFVEEDEDDLTSLYYIHFVLKNIDYLDFISQRRSYRDIFELAKTAFIIKKDLLSQEYQEVYSINSDDIPRSYWPHKKSLYPGKKKTSSSSYKVSLKGGLADLHHALTKDLLEVQRAVVDILSDTLESLPDLSLTAQVFQFADTEGSFQLNFEVSIDTSKVKNKDLFFREELISEYQNSLLEYIIKHLPSEVNQVYSEQDNPVNFNNIVELTKALYANLGKNIEDQQVVDWLKNSMREALDDLIIASNSVGHNYDSLEFISISKDKNNNQLIGSVTESSRPELIDAITKINYLENEPTQDDTTRDEDPQTYNIYIHNLNTETRNGAGTIMFENGEAARVKVTISGSDALDETKFTESLHAHRFIKIVGIGTKKRGKLIRLAIDFDLSN